MVTAESVHFSSNSNEWATPQRLFDRLNAIYGPFTLDPCATAESAKCAKFFTMADNGLEQSWQGETVFMNPPYGRQIGKWIRKARQESNTLSGFPAKVVCLIPARTDTAYWHDCIMTADEIVLLRGRVRFVGGASSAPFPSAVVVFETCGDTYPSLSTMSATQGE